MHDVLPHLMHFDLTLQVMPLAEQMQHRHLVPWLGHCFLW
jgi:hypothetical protein